MYTQCPQCQTLFRITPEQMQAAQGRVRCGECRHLFYAAEFAGEEGSRAPMPPASPVDAAPSAPTEVNGVGKDSPPRSSRGRTTLWLFSTLLLLALLPLQYAHFHSGELSQDPRVRPWLSQLCEVTGCPLPVLRDVEAFELLARNIGVDPRYSGALLITGTFVNRAPFAQPYPKLRVVLKNLVGERVAEGLFEPSEYLATDLSKGVMAAGVGAEVRLPVVDPGNDAVSFEFAFQ